MLTQSHSNLSPGQLFDETSNSKLRVQNGHFVQENLDSGKTERYPLPPLKFKDQKTSFIAPLKFLSKNSNITVNTSGNILTCKALNFQQVEMNKSFSNEIAYWQLYLTQKTPMFTVGIQSKEPKSVHIFDFCISKPTVLTFRLDLETKTFTCWLNGVQSEFHKPIELQVDAIWTPFVRVKTSGTNVILNTLASDPESSVVSYLNSGYSEKLPQFVEPSVHKIQSSISSNNEHYSLVKFTNEKMLMVGENSLKVLYRTANKKFFDFKFAQLSEDEQVTVFFSQNEFASLNDFSKKVNVSLLNSVLHKVENHICLVMNKKEWSKWAAQILSFLNDLQKETTNLLRENNNAIVSLEDINLIAQIILQKTEAVNPLLNPSERTKSLYSEFNRTYNGSNQLPFFEPIKTNFKIPKEIALNNVPFIKFSSQILAAKCTLNSYIGCLMKDGNRISILNAESVAFKVIDTVLSRGFTKEAEINQYKKQIEEIQDSDFTKPHIFKILKNCLKYADKIKPPEKLLKQIEKKKEVIENKKAQKEQKAQIKKPEVTVDKSLLNTLIMMGFGEKLSTKALIECKNQSMEAAIELIVGKYKDEKNPIEIATKPKRDWQCKVCTLINFKDALVCTACNSPAPFQATIDETQLMEEKKEEQAKKAQQTKVEQVTSPPIENEKVNDFYIWNTQVAYCPIIIAAVFDTKIRFRLLGPNPKFYSNFYSKDNGYFDLTTLRSHEFAHQLDQQQISHEFYLSSSPDEQKKANWGWMNIEDWDLNIENNKIASIDFKSLKLSDKDHKFVISINGQTKSHKLNCRIVMDNVYEEKKRCFVVDESKITEPSEPSEQKKNVFERKRNYTDVSELILSANSHIVSEFSLAKAIANTQIDKNGAAASSKSSGKHEIIPLVVVSAPMGAESKYPSVSFDSSSPSAFNKLNQWRNGIVLKAMNEKVFNVTEVKLEQKIKVKALKAGYFYLTNDLSKAPSVKYQFGFGDESGKTTINVSGQKGEYLVVVLYPRQNSNKIVLSGVSVYGQIIDSEVENSVQLPFLDEFLKVQFEQPEMNNKQLSQIAKIKIQLMDYPIDLTNVDESKVQEHVGKILQSGVPIDVRVKLSLKKKELNQVKVKSVVLENWNCLRSFTQYTQQASQLLTEQEFYSCLQSFVNTTQNEYFQILKKENHKSFRSLITKIDLTEFVQKIISCPVQKSQRNKLKNFISIFGPYFQNNQSINALNLIQNALKSQELTSYGAELCFLIVKLIDSIKLSDYFNLIEKQLKQITLRKQTLSLQSTKNISESLTAQKTIFSDLFYRLSSKQKSLNSDDAQIHYHYICQKSINTRKYTIDMMSIYSLDRVQLKFDSSKQKSKLMIEISYIDQTGIQCFIGKRFYEENLWVQLFSNPKGLQNLFFNLNQVKSRYLIVNISFSAVPYAYTKRDEDSIPSCEIVPLVYGSYIGQSEPFLHAKFDISPGKLHLLKKVDNFTKYNIMQAENVFYYSIEEVNDNEKMGLASVEELQKKENSPANRQMLINLLMKNPSKESVNFNLTLSYLLIDAALQSQEITQISDLNLPEKTIELFIEHFINSEKGTLHEKAIRLLRRLTISNTSVLIDVLKVKFFSSAYLLSLFKQIKVNENKPMMQVIEKAIQKQTFIAYKNLAGNLAAILSNFAFPVETVEKFTAVAYEAECYEQTVSVTQKYGWTKSTKTILCKLHKMLASNEGSKFRLMQSVLLIINSAKTNTELAAVAFEQLKAGNNQLYDMILTELSIQISRHTKISEIEDILLYLLAKIQTSEDEEYKREEYLRILGTVNKLGYSPKIVEEIIKVFFKLNEINAYLHQLVGANFLKGHKEQKVLLRTTLNQLDSRVLKSHELDLLNDILAFVLNKQPALMTQKISFTLDPETQSLALHYFANFLSNMLNIGGLESAKLIDQENTQNIKIAFYLSRFLQTEQVYASLKESSLENLIQWLMVNISTSATNTKTPTCLKFLKIQETVWHILEEKGKNQPEQFAESYVKIYKQMRGKFASIKNDTVRFGFNRKLDVFNIRLLENFSAQKKFLANILKENGLFVQILNEFTKLKTQTLNQGKLNSEVEKANELKIHSDANDTPKDWLLYKNGAKNHVYKIEYSKSTNETYELVLNNSISTFTLSKIILGFNHDLNTEKNVCLPKKIQVEAGMGLGCMRYVGEMFQIKDDRYINFSVKLFGFNTNLINGCKDLSLQLNKNAPIKFLRFKIRSPEPVSIEDALATEFAQQKNSTSLINFLSVQGFAVMNSQPYTSELVRFLELISQVEHKDLVNILFNQPTVVEIFKSALINISFLMKNQSYEKTLHKFLMRICQQNTSIGNEMIEKYLQLQNSELCAKISCEIVLSNDKEIVCRTQKYFGFISKILTERKYFSEDIEAFLDRFTQIAFYVMSRGKFDESAPIGKISIKIDLAVISILLKEIEENQRAPSTLINLSKFVKTLITLASPFSIEGIKLKSVLELLYQRKSRLHDQILGSLIIDHKESRSWFMENKYFEAIFEETFNLIKTSPDIAKLNRNLELLAVLSVNTNIKQLINKYQYNLMLFEMLMSKNYQSVLSSAENENLRKNFVNLIARTSMGSENQTVIASLLKDSIPNIISQGNENFVGEIFLPLLNSYEMISVCVLPYSKAENRLITDISNTDLNITSGDAMLKSEKLGASDSKFRLPSTLANQVEKQKIFEQIKKSYNGGNFNLAMNHGNYTSGLSDVFKTKVIDSSLPVMAVLKIKNPQRAGESKTISIFCNRTEKTTDNKLKWSKGSFIMYSEQSDEKKCITIDEEPTKNKDLIQLNQGQPTEDNYISQDEQPEHQLRFYINGAYFVHISLSYNDSNYFCFNKLNKLISDYDVSVLDSAEYWLFTADGENGVKTQSVQDQSKVPTLTQNFLASNYDQSLFSPQHFANRSLKYLRYEKVYEFPSSITVSQLKESLRIINCSLDHNKLTSLQLSLLGSKETFTQEITLQDIRKKSPNKDLHLLDINMNFDNLLSLMDLKQQTKKNQVDFLPRKGILKYFEENDGIQAMIKVIKKSIESWKNKVRMEKWLQYVIELQNFSHFPHFFAIYLKDKETFRLLFNLLAGLPDKETDPKWDELESSSSQKLLKIVSEILLMDKTSQFRDYSLKNNFFNTILERLRILTGIFKRKYDKDYKDSQDEQDLSPSKNQTQDDGTKKIKKKKGVGYGNDQSSNTKWMKGEINESRKKEFEVVEIILNIIENFLDIKHWKIPDSLLENIYESGLLPFIEDGLRAGTLLQISKHPEKFKVIFKIIKTFSKHERLVPVLMPISNNYQPRQIESIESLLKSLEKIASIFLSCLNQNKTNQTKDEQISQELANIIKETYVKVQEAIQEYKQSHMNDENQEKKLEQILELPLDKKYRTLMKDLRFDYIDMKESPTKIKHHYASNFNANYTPNQVKMIRLAQELADISTALPFEHTNAVYVRCDKDRVDFMQAMIMGANGTPYGHGAFLFDVYFDDNYPNNPPKVNLTTTGHGKVRFNPNLYACGKVCLSLLGTWRGSASQNWDAKVSTLLQVLLSIQAIIMSEQVYFNEPGFENEQGTEEGEKKNEAYSNIVRYCNIRYAMIDNIRSPPKGFETIVRRHFYLKKDEIMEECRKWQKYAQKRQANYIGLVNDHNHSWSNEFKKTKTTYKEMLDQAVKQLEEELNKLQPPKITDMITNKQAKKQKKKKAQGNKMQELENQEQQQIDVSYDKNKIEEAKQIDITDQKVKDRWSRYIGAMGIDAVSKQSKADILVFGLNPLGLETVKNLVLSGCRKLTICDNEVVKAQDLAGGFFYTQEDIGKKRLESILYKIKELNMYVKIDTIELKAVTPEVLKTYSLVLTTEIPLLEQTKFAQICRQHKVKFISADSIGFTCRIVNDMGEKFEVLDKNGEEPVEVFAKEITNDEKGIVTLLDGVKNPFEDGEAVLIRNVEGMKLKDEDTKSINDTIHKVKVINSKSFEIGNTLNYGPYVRNGTIKNIKTPVELSYKPFAQIVLDAKNVHDDENLAFYDFSKLQNSRLVKCCYLALEQFRKKNDNKFPEAWNAKDMDTFVTIFKTIFTENIDEKAQKFIRKFALTCRGYLPPLCAFFGGMVCQQIIKAITQKFKPIVSEFYIEFSEIVPQIPAEITQVSLQCIFKRKQSRDVGFESVIGNHLLEVIKDSKLFMIGSGAIGCELLKNFAMIGLGTGEKGKITLTDPDHIENSNLNRQFLFRQKHISKSKSRTASEVVKLMNPSLKNKIVALTERVSDLTKDIFTNKFFEGLTLVANALDNVAARRYVDQRCVENKVPLFESGTLGPKGHVQVIIPYLTESYGSQNDPVEEGEIPHCTLKMFPEETLHCVEWARDIFGKKFSLQPKGLLKVLDKGYKPEKDDIKSLNQSLTIVKKGPKTFEDCISYAIHKFYKYFRDDVMQLLYTYPLDAKTKNGEPFWKLPKRPPTPIKQLDPENMLQLTFVSSLAAMIAKIYQIEYPKNFRSQTERMHIGKLASKVKVADFVPSDQKAKEILKQSTEKKQEKAQEEKKQEVMQEKDENELHKEIITTGGHDFKIKSEQFEKDEDTNGHIDFIYSMANLRAINYKLDPMDWINVKIKAGRIVPALATTTACVSGLQTLEICKYLKKVKIDSMKNSYLNLAVPSIQMSEPGEVIKNKITEKLTVNLWDRWDVECEKSATFGDLYEMLSKKYEINPVGVLQGMSRLDTGKSEQEKKAFLKEKILDKLDLDENYIDVIVLFTKSAEEEKIIEGVPPVRIVFK